MKLNLTYRDKARIITFLLALILFSFFFSCSPSKKAQRSLKRSKKLLAKARLLDPSISLTDTVFKDVPVYVPEVRTDTLIQFEKGDTITIEKDRVRTKVVVLPGDSIFIESECKADTIIQRVPYTVQETVYIKESFWDLIGLDTVFKRILAGLFLIIILLCIIFFRQITARIFR